MRVCFLSANLFILSLSVKTWVNFARFCQISFEDCTVVDVNSLSSTKNQHSQLDADTWLRRLCVLERGM